MLEFLTKVIYEFWLGLGKRSGKLVVLRDWDERRVEFVVYSLET